MERTIIGVLDGHEAPLRHNKLIEVLNRAFGDPHIAQLLRDNYQFVLTGGTFRRCTVAEDPEWHTVDPRFTDDLVRMTTVLPDYLQGGTVLLANLIVQRRCSILWSFLMSSATTLQPPDEGALLRLCDITHTKTLMNQGSIERWLNNELEMDSKANLQQFPLVFEIDRVRKQFMPSLKKYESGDGSHVVQANTINFSLNYDLTYPEYRKDRTIALIAHDRMKERMVEFVVDYERTLGTYSAILSTGTTGGLVREATRTLGEKVYRYHSGTKGGDIEIATEILAGHCHDVVFFVDPINPHPHMDDIRVVIGSCMIREEVQMLKNERQARAWMNYMH